MRLSDETPAMYNFRCNVNKDFGLKSLYCFLQVVVRHAQGYWMSTADKTIQVPCNQRGGKCDCSV